MEWFDSGRLSITLVNHLYYISFYRYYTLTLHFQVCVDHGIVDHYIKAIRTSCVKFTWKDYFALPATYNYSHTFRIDVELDLRKVAR